MKFNQVESPERSEITASFSRQIGGVVPSFHIKARPDGEYLVFEFAMPNDRLYSALSASLQAVSYSNPLRDRVTISARAKKPADVVSIPEARMLQKELSESLTVDKNTFGEDFLSRYTTSVTDHEASIIRDANYVVYGRRGSGKSSLLAYGMHKISALGSPYAWVALQTYAGRQDAQAIASVLADIFFEIAKFSEASLAKEIALLFEDLSTSSHRDIDARISRLTPSARRLIGQISTRQNPLTIFLDDLHVVDQELQPKLLASIYAMTRGNHAYIKASGIEQFTNIWDAQKRVGLEPPHDAQILKLDYNLTMPDRSKAHIVSILDAHARYCGLPSASYLCEDAVLSRLVLVAAAVPRDALSLFSQAITKSLVKGQKAVTITSVNAAASETIEEKLKDIGRDAVDAGTLGLQGVLDELKDFCIKQHGINAFLFKIDNRSSAYRTIQSLIALRFLHVLHEGITPHKVGERYVALMLDFGFYTGVRAAKSVRLFPEVPKQLAAKDLRKLPIFVAGSSVSNGGKPARKSVKKPAKRRPPAR